jgi:hypothetical protein
VDVVFSILRDLSAITVLFGVFIFMYVLMGMELFAYKLKDTQSQTSTFNTFLESFLSVFIVLANDGWTKIYFNHQRYFDPISTSIYFISLVLLGQFILLNMVISIIIENFEQQSIKSDFVRKITDLNEEE